MIRDNFSNKICFIFNIRLNNEYRLDRLLYSLSNLCKYPGAFFSIRIRGDLTFLALERVNHLFQSRNLVNYKLYNGDEFKSWKMNTLKQVIESGHEHFVLLQEDHLLLETINVLSEYLSELITSDAELGHITSWHTYSEIRSRIMSSNFSKKTDLMVVYQFDKSSWQDLQKNNLKYLVPLVSYFKRSLITRILLTVKPIWRKYPTFSPFDFEQGPNASWLFPIKIGFPRKEIFACIDDDIGVPGTSLQSRGLYPIDQVRTSEHHNSSITSFENKLIILQRNLLSRFVPFGVYESLRNAYAQKIWAKSINKLIQFLRFIDSCFYTFHNLFNNILNFKEISYKRYVKKIINFQ